MLKEIFIKSFDICAFESAIELKSFSADDIADFSAYLAGCGFDGDAMNNILSFVATKRLEND